MRQTPLRRLVALALVALPTAVAAAQTDSRQWPPALVADSFFRATRAERWADAVRFLDLEAIARLRDEQVRRAQRRPVRTPVTAETYLQFDPKMPREVAEYQARRTNEQMDDMNFLELMFARVTSPDTLAAMPLAEVAARWLEAKGLRAALHQSVVRQRKMGCDISDSLEVAMMPVLSGTVPIKGAVIEDSLAWVLHDDPRFPSDPPPPASRRVSTRRGAWFEPPQITTLLRTGGTWRIEPGFESGGMSFSLAEGCPTARGRGPA